jgi:hypothetical protein
MFTDIQTPRYLAIALTCGYEARNIELALGETHPGTCRNMERGTLGEDVKHQSKLFGPNPYLSIVNNLNTLDELFDGISPEEDATRMRTERVHNQIQIQLIEHHDSGTLREHALQNRQSLEPS